MKENNFIESLISEGENDQLELISQFDNDRIAATICGFLNFKGGRVLVGVNDNKQPVGLEYFKENFEELNHYILEHIYPMSIVSVREESFKGRPIVLIEVIEGNKKPYSYKNKTFIRVGGSTKIATDDDMSYLIRDRKTFESSWERSPCLEVEISDLDTSEIERVIGLANNIRRSKPFDPKDIHTFLNANQLTFNQGFTNGSVVLFGRNPTYFLPQCLIRIVEFGDGKTGNEFRNTILIEDNLFTAFKIVQDYFKKSTPLKSKFSEDNWQRIDKYKYPLQAIDEGVINAMMHRDYSDNSGEVFIGVYPDKVEIINSGELPHFFSDSYLKKSHKSIPPNPTITHIVFLCGMIEKIGRGTVLIYEQFKERGLPSPHWESKNGFTKLTMYGEPKQIELNDRMKDFIANFPNDEFSRAEYETYFKGLISEKTARNDLSALVDADFLKIKGAGRSTTYLKNKRKLPEITE